MTDARPNTALARRRCARVSLGVRPQGGKVRILAAFAFAGVLLLSHGLATGKDYCPPVPKTEKEGDPWIIPESAFTKEAANKALAELASQINAGLKGRDFLMENDLRMIKGYLYRAHLAESEKESGKVDPELRKEFCQFLTQEAYVEH